MTKSALIIGTLLVLTGSADVALAQSARTQVECSMLDVAATTMIEDHGRVADVSPERLYGAALVMQEARKACRDERFNEARALYDLVLSLGPVVGQASESQSWRAWCKALIRRSCFTGTNKNSGSDPVLGMTRRGPSAPISKIPIQFERGRRGCGGRSARWSPGCRRPTWSSGAASGLCSVD